MTNFMTTLITEISENDFRKLDLTVWEHDWQCYDSGRKLIWKPRKLNDILDEQIKYECESGYEENLLNLSIPITIAVHVNNVNPETAASPETQISYGYWDKFMNRFTPESTYEIGLGIKHLYSTRDYYEAHEDYWRVNKKETKVIYRVHLNKRNFTLKHKQVVLGVIDKNTAIYGNYDLVDGEWVLRNKTKIIRNEHSTIYEPYEDNKEV